MQPDNMEHRSFQIIFRKPSGIGTANIQKRRMARADESERDISPLVINTLIALTVTLCGSAFPAGGTFIYLYRIMQISPPLPSLMMRVSVSCSFFRASSGIRFSLVCRSSLTTS